MHDHTIVHYMDMRTSIFSYGVPELSLMTGALALTKPTDAMREVIAKAEVGDDVYGEDPCVNSVEAMAAKRTF